MTKYKWDIPTNKDKIIGWQGKRIIALEDELDALREAVEWHFEILATRPKEVEDYHGFCADEKDMRRCNNQQVEHEILRLCARAEVDRLIASEGADGCQNEQNPALVAGV